MHHMTMGWPEATPLLRIGLMALATVSGTRTNSKIIEHLH